MNEQQEKIVARLGFDPDLAFDRDKGWVLDLGPWEPPAGMHEDDWVEVTIRRYEFQP